MKILKIYYASSCTNMRQDKQIPVVAPGSTRELRSLSRVCPMQREELVTVPQKAQRNANRQMARAVICKADGDSSAGGKSLTWS